MLGLMAVALFVLGILTAYFGSGKSRTVGAILLVLGIVVGAIDVFVIDHMFFNLDFVREIIYPAVFYLVAAVVGAVIGLLIFLGAIMKT
ncbi:MAG: hypothetical protein QW597_02255 [Thermoplasmataceae archaeon]